MSMNRRIVLKTLLMSPFYGIAQKLCAVQMSDPTVKGTLNILLNGLFFMERLPDPANPTDSSKSLLAVRAPKVSDHVFLAGTRGNLKPSTGFDWSKGFGLSSEPTTFDNPQAPEIPREVPTSVLQFTRKETGLGGFNLDNSLYLGTVILPWPKIFSLRQDKLPPFDQGLTQRPKNVAPKIKARCGNQVGEVICLQYQCDFSGPVLPPDAPIMNVHLHMLCCKDSDGTVKHINTALNDSTRIFQLPGFDLNMNQVVIQPAPYDPQPQVPGVTLEDERAAIEDGACRGMQTADAIREKLLLKGHKEAFSQRNGEVQKNKGSKVNVSPANCPAFFVG